VVFEQCLSVFILCGFWNSVGQLCYCVVFQQFWSVVILCGLGAVLVSVYNVWFLNSVGQCLYCVVFE
jgi:NADH:ubiquinone oxidoreductase subunit 4 (subunit M)